MERKKPHIARKARLPFWRRLAWRLSASFLVLTTIAILLSGFLQYRAQERELSLTAPEGQKATVSQEGMRLEADSSIVFDQNTGLAFNSPYNCAACPDSDDRRSKDAA